MLALGKARRKREVGCQPGSHTTENVHEPLWNALILDSLSAKSKPQAWHGDTHASYATLFEPHLPPARMLRNKCPGNGADEAQMRISALHLGRPTCQGSDRSEKRHWWQA